MYLKTRAAVLLSAAMIAPAFAQDETDRRLNTISVHGRGLDLIGEADAASEGVVGYADFKDRPLSRAGELVEVIPGVVATQHSGEGKANQYFLRGFNLDHGSDFSASVDGIPINMRSHGHGQGYMDLNSFIPEMIERVDYRKGPYYASNGDFSVAGAARYATYDTLEDRFIELKIGENDYRRIVGGYSTEVAEDTHLLIAGEAQTYDGPWELPLGLEKYSGLAKLSRTHGPLNYQISLTGYDNSWTSTDQIPQRAVASGLIDRFGFIDDDPGGETSRYSLAGSGSYAHTSGASTEVSAYIVDYSFSLWSDATFFQNDPVNGDEFKQTDERTYFGGRIFHQRPLSSNTELRMGLETRYDDIDELGLFASVDRQPTATLRLDSVKELSLSGWAEADIHLPEALRVTLGLRGDYLDGDVTALSHPVNGGHTNDTLLSPSLSLAWRASDQIEFYANYGEGFHTNDVRGGTIMIDPINGTPADRVPLFSKAKGGEIGFRYENGDFRSSVAIFTLKADSELIFVGDAGTTEVNDATERTGIETTFFWRPTDWIVTDFSAAYTDGKFDISDSADKIPNSVDTVLSGGVLFNLDPVTLSARLRHFGSSPLIEDGSVTSDPTTIVNLGATYDWKSMTFGLEILNALDAEDNDITYYFESQLADEVAPVEDIHFHPVEPRQLRFSVRYRF